METNKDIVGQDLLRLALLEKARRILQGGRVRALVDLKSDRSLEITW